MARPDAAAPTGCPGGTGARSGRAGSTAESWAHRAVALAPGDERAWQKLIEVQIQAGNPAGAIATFRKLCQVLAEEFGLAPSAATRALVDALM